MLKWGLTIMVSFLIKTNFSTFLPIFRLHIQHLAQFKGLIQWVI